MKKFDLQQFLKDLEQLVNIDSNGSDPEGTNKVAAYIAAMFNSSEWYIKYVDGGSDVGHAMEITNTEQDEYDVVVITHMDTVFDRGEAAKRPFKIENGIAYGPGVTDMKSGLLLGVYAALNCVEELKPLRICLAFNSEEEKGSQHYQNWFYELGKKSSYAIVMEPGRPHGEHVFERKGVAMYNAKFHGKDCHAGTNHQDGRSAINEMAYWIGKLSELTNYETGVTVNVGLVKGGIGINTVAAEAEMGIDLRVKTLDQIDIFTNKVAELREHAKEHEITVEIDSKAGYPPMFKSEKTDEFIALVNKEALKLGLSTEWISVGGGSDGSFVASVGVPTIDAMGPIGGRAHTPEEYLEVDSIEPAYELLANVLLQLKKKLYA